MVHISADIHEEESLAHDVLMYCFCPSDFFGGIFKGHMIRAYRAILLVRHKQGLVDSQMLDLKRVLEVTELIEKENLGVALDVLALTAYRCLCDRDSKPLDQVKVTLSFIDEALPALNERSLHIVHVLLKSLLDRKLMEFVKTQDILAAMWDCVTNSDSKEVYFVAMETIRLLVDQKLVEALSLRIPQCNRDRFLMALCDLAGLLLPTDDNLNVWLEFVSRNMVFEVLLEQCGRKLTEVESKRVVFLLQTFGSFISELKKDFSLPLIQYRAKESASFKAAWSSFGTMMEALRGNQKHLILPTFSRMSHLKSLHVRWKLSVLEQGFLNDNAHVQFWCARHVLESPQIWPEMGEHSSFVSVINNPSFFEDNLDLAPFHRLLESNLALVPINRLQKAIPIYHTAMGYLRAMPSLPFDLKVTTTNKILVALRYCSNTRIREAIVREVVSFVWASEIYKKIGQLSNVHLLSSQHVPETHVGSATIVSIFRSKLPIPLKMTFRCSDVDSKTHPDVALFQSPSESEVEEILTTFVKELEMRLVPRAEWSLVQHFLRTGLERFEDEKLESHIIQNCANALLQTAIKVSGDAGVPIEVKIVALDVLEAARTWKNVAQTLQVQKVPALNAKRVLRESKERLREVEASVAASFFDRLSRSRAELTAYPASVAFKENFGVPVSQLFEESLEFVSCGGSGVLVSELGVLKVLLQYLVKSGESVDYEGIRRGLDVFMRQALDCRSSTQFRKFLDSFVRAIIWSEKIELEWFTKITLPYYQELLNVASSTRGLANNLFEDLLYGIEMAMIREDFDLVQNVIEMPAFEDLLVTGLLFGDIQSKERRLESALCSQIGETSVEKDVLVRWRCNQLLTRTDPLFFHFFEGLKKRLLEMFLDLGRRHPIYFENSKTHRDKLRLCQSLCLLLQKDPSGLSSLYGTLFEENNLLSVTSLLELMVGFLSPQKDFEGFLSPEFVQKLKPAALQSLFVVIFYRIQTVSPESKKRYLEVILPFTMGQQFSTRIYAQIAILYSKVTEEPFQSLRKAISSCISGKSDQSYVKALHDFRFLFPHFTLEEVLSAGNVFHHIPKLTNMGSEEINSDLRGSLAHIEVEEAPKRGPESLEPTSFDNVQMKIVPSKSLTVDPELFESLPSHFRTSKTSSHLIIVASLVSKLPNLGGLARTCEIFNVQTYAISSLRHVSHHDFKNVSVGAEKWLNLAEVQPSDVPQYLRSLKAQGYVVVGAEQTADSKKIHEFSFPPKTVLLLGEEKEGIPANLIALLDAAVEIPQFGVCRSLNVHVCASICLWEYSKQNQIKSF